MREKMENKSRGVKDNERCNEKRKSAEVEQTMDREDRERERCIEKTEIERENRQR